MSTKHLLSTLFLLILFSMEAGARSGAVSGRVMDDGDKPLGGVKITSTSPSGGVPVTTRTRGNGEFTFDLPELDWEWELLFILDGYRDATVSLPPGLSRDERIELIMVRENLEAGEEGPDAKDPAAELRDLAAEIYNQGVAALDAGDEKAAAELFHQSAASDPSYDRPLMALASMAVKAENWPEAGKAAEALLVVVPDDIPAMGTAYTAAVKAFDVDRLEPAARRLATADPGTLDNMVEVAVWMYEADKLAAAKELLVVITEVAPERVEPHYVLGLTANATGDTELARVSFERFLAMAPGDHPERQTAQELLEYLEN